ncbi:MAG: Rrf2 family transcriptional regulator [Novosphingobium sp.]|jgi:Rrf2 family protein|nr:Rrf2 family transcriptional regulator [Novosphingobium sp.]
MLSQKTRYTIRALQHLADNWRQGPVRLDAIAETQNIPRKFLTVILSEMVREGLVISHRGREGGYELALAPVDICYGDIIRLTRGSLALVPCASRNAHEHCSNCLPEAECRLRGLMLTLRDEMASMLDRITLADSIALVPSFPDVVQQSAA